MTKQESLLRQLSAVQFSLWELHLYLDTHSNDLEALALHEKYEIKYYKLKEEYEKLYGRISPSQGEGIEWLKNPWPWDISEGDK